MDSLRGQQVARLLMVLIRLLKVLHHSLFSPSVLCSCTCCVRVCVQHTVLWICDKLGQHRLLNHKVYELPLKLCATPPKLIKAIRPLFPSKTTAEDQP